MFRGLSPNLVAQRPCARHESRVENVCRVGANTSLGLFQRLFFRFALLREPTVRLLLITLLGQASILQTPVAVAVAVGGSGGSSGSRSSTSGGRGVGSNSIGSGRCRCSERLAEHDLKHHRDLMSQTNLYRASIYWYMRETQRRTVSSNSRSPTVLFRQYSANLSSRSGTKPWLRHASVDA